MKKKNITEEQALAILGGGAKKRDAKAELKHEIIDLRIKRTYEEVKVSPITNEVVPPPSAPATLQE